MEGHFIAPCEDRKSSFEWLATNYNYEVLQEAFKSQAHVYVTVDRPDSNPWQNSTAAICARGISCSVPGPSPRSRLSRELETKVYGLNFGAESRKPSRLEPLCIWTTQLGGTTALHNMRKAVGCFKSRPEMWGEMSGQESR